LEEGLPDAQLFAMRVTDGHFEDIIHFLTIGTIPKGYTIQQKKELVAHGVDSLSLLGIYTRWGMMKYCEGTYLSLNEVASSQMLMGTPREDIM